MKIFHCPSPSAEQRVARIVNRGLVFSKKEMAAVSRICEDVRKRGDQAVISYTHQFDSSRVTSRSLRVTDKEFSEAAQKVHRTFSRALNRAADNIKSFHQQQRRRSWMQTDRPGTLLGQLIHPVDAAGVYVPGARGGQTPLVSSVLMGVIPAKVAGVKQIVMVTPPTQAGGVSPHLLVAAKKAGADAVYKAGSAWAIAALAYGTQTIPKVDVIVGPGNIYVTLAKKILVGTVGIDSIAGPSEILVIADAGARPDFIAADLLSQAEHDALSSALLITDSLKMAKAVAEQIKAQLPDLARVDIAKESLRKFGAIFVVKRLSDAVDMANRIAPEHLELHVRDPFEVVGQIRNAGAVFAGDYTPEPVGDYMAGPNHVLPTAGTARFASALSVDNFIKKTSVIQYTRKAFRREAADIMRLAEIEGLGAHARSVKIRL
ncbi:MAG: histidinol dehydrogenase [Deltaproteobacteria bacterium]|jgi:histidinol dehydrogenase|nr:histidinol dehydrogenase [Deltaproteobacteria bacterium]